MQFFAAPGAAAAPDFVSKKLVLPAESVGNVGQLTADLLIATCSMTLAGYLESPFLQPCAGRDAYSNDGTLHLALELYEDSSRGLLVLQQRSPALRGCQAALAAQLADWLQGAGVSQVIYLGSLDAKVRRDAQIAGSQLRFVASDAAAGQLGASLGVDELEDEVAEAAAGAKLLPPWPLLEAAKGRGVSLLAVLAFTSDGENVADAHSVAKAVGGCLALGGDDTAWQQPASWNSVYGRPRDAAVY